MINSEPEPSRVETGKTLDTMKKRFRVIYLGSSSMDRRYTQCIQPWVMAEIRRKKEGFRDVTLDVLSNSLRATAWDADGLAEILFEHKLQELTRFAKLHQDPRCFAYLSRQQLNNDDFECHVFLTAHDDMVPEIFNTIRETTKDLNKDGHCGEQVVNHSSMGEGNFDQSKAFFEVKYMGRIRVTTRKVPTSFIDDLVDRFDAREEERQLLAQQMEIRQRHASGTSVRSLPASLDDAVTVTENNLECQQQRLHIDYGSTESSTDELVNLASSSENLMESSGTFSSHENSRERDTNGSSSEFIGYCPTRLSTSGNGKDCKVDFNMESGDSQENLTSDDGDQDREVFCDTVLKVKPETNRIMLFQIGRQDISLISLDQKQIIMERKFKDISFVSQGSSKQDVFGVISREPSRDVDHKSDGNIFVCYIFRCHSESVVSDIMSNLQTAFTMAFKQSQATKWVTGKPQSQNQICIMCPLHQLEKLCREINGMSPHAAYDFLLKRIQHLSDQDTSEIAKRLKNENPQSYDETVEVLMISLRRLCERKQKEHVHISEGGKNVKSEFNIMDNDRNLMFKFDNLRNRAKKSLTNSFESLLRGRKKDDFMDGFRHRSGTNESEGSWSRSMDSQMSTPDASPVSSPVVKEFHHQFPSPPHSPEGHRKRSSTVGAIPDPAITASRRNIGQRRQTEAKLSVENYNNNHLRSPLKNMFLLAGCPSPSTPDESCTSPMEDLSLLATPRRISSWRQAIFNKVVTPVQFSDSDPLTQDDLGTDRTEKKEKLTPFQLRCLWKKAILETLLLIRMERENHNLQARQDAIEQQRKKTDYQEITPCLKEVTKIWDELLAAPQRGQTKISSATIVECVKKGVPRCYRGEIWKLLVEQHRLCNVEGGADTIPETPYCDLLRQLTTHQHSILIDLGRTFPGHPYFSAQLGNGQLELFNLLKAYSLLDEEVGYCQGLSFVVGVLLMHMSEDDAFETMKYLMFRFGLQKQYRPNMMALQVKLYQLTRLIHDHHRELYDHFERHEIAPTLYAAPWFLTLFASQFPLGFVARCFDMIFIQGIDAVFKISLMLLSNHRELILHCDSFESIVEFLKTTLPDMVHVQMERIVNQAFEMDISKELHAYEVEYHVLREEMLYSPRQQQGDTAAAISKLEGVNRALRQQNMDLLEKLQQTNNHLHSLELNVHTHQSNETKLKSHIRTLELERAALLNAVAKLRQTVPQDRLEKLELMLPAFTPSLPASPVLNLTNNRLQNNNVKNLANEHIETTQQSSSHKDGHTNSDKTNYS
ncbi:TBC1 domain family member 4-like isoform X2 [Gigantopelta aegis]|uniref:TBC1 domain family member 4-like isoform X2 n=1 Tax=Gigantopelta aegis TaxID=1735272 RepID=UPI001B88BCF1|nr:TBC1 domain family member 4-like isoform X2 [Gigantopelta aegis]